MPDKQKTYGQYDTPPDVADLLLAFCLRGPNDRLLDPSCGTGAFLARAARLQGWLGATSSTISTLWGIEIDPQASALAEKAVPQARIVNHDFFALAPNHGLLGDDTYHADRFSFDAIVGNPPYTRAEWIEHLASVNRSARQITMFDEAVTAAGLEVGRLPDDATSSASPRSAGSPYTVPGTFLSRRSGLHAYFFVHGTAFLREGGRFAFVVPNSWLDVGYGERLKQFLLDHYKILALIESSVERWFTQAKVNTCLTILEKCSDAADRENNRVRLVRLRKPLHTLIPYDLDDRQRLSHLERLAGRLLPAADVDGEAFGAHVVAQAELAAQSKWGLALRAPAVYHRRSSDPVLQPLNRWAEVKRGFTSGANSFFYLDDEIIRRWSIEPQFRRPLLKSLREVRARQVKKTDCNLEVLYLPGGDYPPDSGVAAYIHWGWEQGWHTHRTCAARQFWYSLPEQEQGPILMAKGIWQRYFSPLVDDSILVDQQIYRIFPVDGVPIMAAAALLNSAWCALQMELTGRVNFGEGVLWLASYELAGLWLSDPRYLKSSQVDDLTAAFEPMLHCPVEPIAGEVGNPAWQDFNKVVLDVMGFSSADRREVIQSLLKCAAERQLKTENPS